MTLYQAGSPRFAEGEFGKFPTKEGFRPDIEGLRAVAVLAVVLFHAEVPGVGGGFVGVDVFFVISGFLITGLIWREANTTGTVRLRRFYGARARRLLPASAMVGVVTAVAAAVLLPPLQVSSVLHDGIASALYVSNYWFILSGVDYFGGHMPASPFQHYWSLGVEEQFYLVWPALIIGTAWLLRRVRRGTRAQATASQGPYLVVLALVSLASFAMSLVLSYVTPAVAFFSLPTRAWQLALGGVVALSAGQWRRLTPRAAAIAGWIGLGMIVLGCTQIIAITRNPGMAALLPTLGAVLVIGAGCATPDNGCGRFLAVSPMQKIGRFSYSWYLWHWPVLVLVPLLVGHPFGLPARVGLAVLSAGLAALTLRFLENPLRFAPRIRNSPWLSMGLGVAATAIAVCASLVLLNFVPTPIGRGAQVAPVTISARSVPPGSGIADYDSTVRHVFAQVQAAVSASAAIEAVPSNLVPPLAAAADEQKAMVANGCLRGISQGGQPECATGDLSSATRVVLVGDSHAAMWNPAFQQIAIERRWRLEMLAKGACPLMDLPSKNPLRHLVEQSVHCEQWRGDIMARLRDEHPQLVVVSMWRGYDVSSDQSFGIVSYDAAWLDSLTRLVQQLRGTGAKVLVLGPVPDPQFVVPICLSGHLDDASACTLPRSTAVNANGIAAESVATAAGGGQYADLTELFCAANLCPVIVGNTLVYFDWGHTTLEYTGLLAPVMAALADRALAGG